MAKDYCVSGIESSCEDEFDGYTIILFASLCLICAGSYWVNSIHITNISTSQLFADGMLVGIVINREPDPERPLKTSTRKTTTWQLIGHFWGSR